MMKERAWQAAAISTGASVEQCKQRWKSLRDRFVREVATQKSKSGSAADEKAEWCYLESMRFLTKHVAPRRTISNLQWSCDDQQNCSNSPLTPQSDLEQTIEECEWVELVQDECVDAALNASQCSVESSKAKKAPKRQRLEEKAHERYSRLCGTIETVFTANSIVGESKNNGFLSMLDDLLKKKPEEVQERLKIEILNHVHNSN